MYRTLEALEDIALCFQLRYFQELDKIEKEYHRRLHTTTKGDASVMREEDSSELMASLVRVLVEWNSSVSL